jgi:hypothetical protein
MSLTETDNVFAGVHENGLNDLLRAVFHTRPHYLNYGSPPFVSASTVSATAMPTIPFPGIPGGIGWSIRFGIPTVDLDPDSSGGALPPEITFAKDSLTVHTHVRLCIFCGVPREQVFTHLPPRPGKPICAELDVWALGVPIVRHLSAGDGVISFFVSQVEIVDIAPDPLESLLECLIRMTLQAALDKVEIPFHALRAGAFSLQLTRGPEVANDTLKLWGTL